MINRILIYNSGGGIGDAIQILPLINSLKNEFKEAEFNYLCAHENHFNTLSNRRNRFSELPGGTPESSGIAESLLFLRNINDSEPSGSPGLHRNRRIVVMPKEYQ